MVTADSGIRVEPESPDQYAYALATSIKWAASSPAWLRSARIAAQERAAFVAHWPVKQQRIDRLYAEIVNRGR